MKQSTFNVFVSKTISNEYLHLLLIVIEYLLFIFPSCVDSAMKLNHFNTPKDVYSSSITDIYAIMILKYIHANDSPYPSIIISSIAIVLMAIFALFNCFGTLKINGFGYVEWVLANVYNLVFFRYFSILFVDSFLMLFVHFSREGSSMMQIIAVVYFLLCVVFVLLNYSFIIECNTLMNISNPELVEAPRAYPFDQLSKQYEMIIFLIKFLTSLECNYFRHSDSISLVIISINAMIVILSFVLCFWLFIMNTCFYWSYSFYFANVKQNTLRKGISIFNCLFLLFGVFIFKSDSSLLCIVLLSVLCLNISLIVLFFEHHISTRLRSSHCELSYEIILLMLISDLSDKKMMRRIKMLQNATIRSHKMNCKYNLPKTDVTCHLCQSISFDIQGNIRVLYKHLKHFQRRSKAAEPFYEEMVKLLFYKTHKKPFKFFQYYYVLMYKYDSLNKLYARNTSLIANVWFMDNSDNYHELIDYLLQVNGTDDKVKSLLVNLDTFFKQSLALKKPETVIKLSSDLSNAIASAKVLLNHSTKLSLTLSQVDNSVKNINEALNYNITILRFIIETLINQSLNCLSPLNIEFLEDYLHLHYDSDRILICSIDLSLILNQEIRIIKASGDLVDYSNPHCRLCEYFPKDIVKEGIALFNSQINLGSSPKAKAKSFTFPFPFLKQGLIEYIKYSFKMVKMLSSPDMFIFGFYSTSKRKTLLLNMNHSRVIIVEMCREFLRLIHFKRQWVLLLKEINVALYLHSIFKVLILKDSVIECEFNRKFFLQSIQPVFNELRALPEFKANSKNETNLIAAVEKIRKCDGEPVKLLLEKITEYKKGFILFDMVITKEAHKSVIIETKLNRDEELTEGNGIKDNNLLFNMQSSSSVCSVSKDITSTTHSKESSKSSVQLLHDSALKAKIAFEEKKLSFFTVIMLGLNISLIAICTVFLILEATQTNQLSTLAAMYFSYKGLRFTLLNLLLSLLASLCYSSTSAETTSCLNGFKVYTEYFQTKYGMPVEFSFLEYASYELKYKAQDCLDAMSKFKQFLFTSSQIELRQLMDINVSYFEFSEDIDENFLISKNVTIEEAMRKYINSFLLVTSTLNTSASYTDLPVYFIRYEKGKYFFSESTKRNLTPIHKEIYKVLTNYLNFFYPFSSKDSLFYDQFSSLAFTNYVMTITFMVAIGLLNLLLCVICKNNIDTAYHIFKVLIYNIVYQTEKSENMEAKRGKTDNLLLLVKFYKNNPNSLIKKIAKSQYEAQSKKAAAQSNGQAQGQPLDKKDRAQVKVSFGSNFYLFLLGRLIKLLVFAFGVFFTVIIVFDCFVVTEFLYVMDLYDYVLLTYNSDHTLVRNIAITSLINVVNMTNEDLAGLMGEPSRPPSILNDMIKENLVKYNALLQYTNLNNTRYPTQEHHYPYTYDELFKSLNDTFIAKVSSELGKDYRKAQTAVCKAFLLLNMPNINYVRSDLASRNVEMLNKLKKGNYTSIYLYVNDLKLYSLYTIDIMFFNSISKTFRSSVLIPKLQSVFDVFVGLTAAYLVIHICLEIVLFFAVRWGISKTITNIQTNLYLLNNCVA